jgi:hypothetical protein
LWRQQVVVYWTKNIRTYLTDMCFGVSTGSFWLSIQYTTVQARAMLSVCDTEIATQIVSPEFKQCSWSLALVLPNTVLFLRGVTKTFGEWYQKTKTEDKDKITLLAFKIIAILHNTLLATFINLLETVSKSLFRNRSQNRCHIAPAGARSGEYGGWTSFCFSAWRASWKAHVLQTWR